MTTVTAEIDARKAARLADRLRDVVTDAEPPLEPEEMAVLDKTACFLDRAAGVKHGAIIKQSPLTGETYVVEKWIDLDDGGIIALAEEPADDEGTEAER